jgi:hypothetical protein
MTTGDARFLIIVARHERSLYGQLQQLFEDNERIEVVVDRRVVPPLLRSHGEQRTLDVNPSLRTFGWAIVPRPGAVPTETDRRQISTVVELVRSL